MRILVLSFPDLRRTYPQRPHQFLKHLSKRHTVTVMSMNSWWLKTKQDPYRDDCLKQVDFRYPSQMRIHPVLQELSMVRHSRSSAERGGGEYDLVLSFNELVASHLIARSKRIPLVLDICDDIPSYIGSSLRIPYPARPIAKSISKLFLMTAIQRSSLVTYTTNALTATLKMPPGKSKVVSNGVEVALFRNKGSVDRQALGISDGEKVVGFVGFVGEWIDLETPLLAVKRLSKRGINLKMMIVGNGANIGRLEERASELGIRDRLIVAGSTSYSNIPRYISCMDVCILPFKRNAVGDNALPLKLFEYMACEKPVISSPVKGVVDAVGDLVAYGETVDEYVYQLKRIIQSGWSKELSKRGMKLVEEKHDWAKICENLEDILTGVAGRNAG